MVLPVKSGDLRNGLQKVFRHLPADHKVSIVKVRNRFEVSWPIFTGRSVDQIAGYIEKEPAADYLCEVDLLTKDGNKARWGVCFYSQIRDYRSDLEYRGRMLSLLTLLDCQIAGASFGMTPIHIQGREGIYSLYLSSRFTKASLPVASLALDRLCQCAEEALTLLTPGYYSISPTSAFELPRRACDYDLRPSDLTSFLEVAA